MKFGASCFFSFFSFLPFSPSSPIHPQNNQPTNTDPFLLMYSNQFLHTYKILTPGHSLPHPFSFSFFVFLSHCEYHLSPGGDEEVCVGGRRGRGGGKKSQKKRGGRGGASEELSPLPFFFKNITICMYAD